MAPGLALPRTRRLSMLLRHLRRDWAHPCHICAGTVDAMSLRILLSLMGLTTTEPCTFKHVVMEVSDMDNREIFHLVGKSMVETVVAHDVMGRLMIQCALQVQIEPTPHGPTPHGPTPHGRTPHGRTPHRRTPSDAGWARACPT